MPDPVLHLLVGPNGAGKSTLHEEVVGPATRLEFVNADIIAAERWPGNYEHSEEAAALAARRRSELIERRQSFATKTVFSHRSRMQLVRAAADRAYLITLHVVMVPEELAVARVQSRVHIGGHPIDEDKIRARFQRLWVLVGDAIDIVDTAFVYDNSRVKRPFALAATFMRGSLLAQHQWPAWTPAPLRNAGRSGTASQQSGR
jgi:predicted ABC-type ATPase